ncbi:hypothetical protein EQZ23_12150 [Sphingomonas sp. UV9]|uniref:hypothetical protein n=1 Tax=Sphingomonas sp. UV9 TaxID=1851410 RepID=UPI000FFC1230|nr:hypothetical protein [Sphingomonas sp. UV9]RXD05771.1 hypothetical protein EQZ23_12150 [Sphingomonas sp. UV9]
MSGNIAIIRATYAGSSAQNGANLKIDYKATRHRYLGDRDHVAAFGDRGRSAIFHLGKAQ